MDNNAPIHRLANPARQRAYRALQASLDRLPRLRARPGSSSATSPLSSSAPSSRRPPAPSPLLRLLARPLPDAHMASANEDANAGAKPASTGLSSTTSFTSTSTSRISILTTTHVSSAATIVSTTSVAASELLTGIAEPRPLASGPAHSQASHPSLPACALIDALERDARLLDSLNLALELRIWSEVEVLLAQLARVQLRLRSKSYARVFHTLVYQGQMRLARRVLELGPCAPPSERQLSRMAEDALRKGTRSVVELLLRRYPQLLGAPACRLPRIARIANGQALTGLLNGGLALPALEWAEVEPLLLRLLEVGSQEWACRLLQHYRAQLVPGVELLQQALNTGAARFIAGLLPAMPAHASRWQDILYQALEDAVMLGFKEGALLLAQHGVDLLQRPRRALQRVASLVEREKTHALAVLVQSGQLSLHTLLLRLAHRGKQKCLVELQGLLKLSFSSTANACLGAPEPGAACSALLRGLIERLRLAAQDRGKREIGMLCVLLESGLSYAAAVNLCALRDRVLQAGRPGPGLSEQQMLMALAGRLAQLQLSEAFWPDPGEGPLLARLRSELILLRTLGMCVLADGQAMLPQQL